MIRLLSRPLMFRPLVMAATCGVLLSASLTTSLTAAQAGPISSACLGSGRKEANRPLCNCIQQAADYSLSRADQRRAAKFFRDPDAAHATWISQRPADDAFWERYKAFGAMAEAYCGG